ncbi:MAG: ABC transporter substrate-binding protein, partial [Planctomycetota bacterium]
MPRPTLPSFLRTTTLAAALLLSLAVGCGQQAPPPTDGGSTGNESASAGSGSTGSGTIEGGGQGLDVLPTDPDDIASVPLMTEIDGIEIPRLAAAEGAREVGGEVPVDEFNDAADKKYNPVKGGGINVRFNAEPKTLNPITETSAYQSYIQTYFHDALFAQNPETFVWEPDMASAYVAEDSVKLRADFPGYERTLKIGDAASVASATVTIPEDSDAEPVTGTILDASGEPVPQGWVGLYAVGGDEPLAGLYADEAGVVTLAFDPGTYEARPGAELFGTTETAADGSVTVTPVSAGNPLAEPASFAAADVVDLQRSTIYTFTLRDDVTWQDDAPFTTQDLRFAYAVINNLFVDGDSLRTYYSDVVRVEAVDELNCRIQYRTQYFKSFEFAAGLGFYAPPFHYFKKLLADDGLGKLTLERLTPEEEEATGEVSAHGQVFGKFFNTDDRYNRAPLGVGPYRVTDWQKGNKVDLVRRDDYWNPDRGGHLDRITFKFIDDNITALQAVRGGQVDFNSRLTPEQYFEELTQSSEREWVESDYVKARWYYPAFSYLGWNLRRPQFQDRRVRLALRLLFDVEEYVEKKLYDSGVLVSGSQYIFGPAYDQNVRPIAYDPETARDLLADAGWIDTDGDNRLDKDGEPFTFSLLMPSGNDTVRDQAALLQRRFK